MHTGKQSASIILGLSLGIISSKAYGQMKDAFSAYTAGSLSGGPSIVETAPLTPGIKERTVTTFHGPVQIPMVEGRRIMFAYPDEEFYANMKVEILPEKGYSTTRTALVDDFDHVLASGGTVRNYGLKPTLNGFEIRGLDREKIEGGVLGIYLLFDDTTHMVTTIYFLNQERSHFHSITEYGALRDRFLAGYTSCVRNKKV